jgi:hypothetical protein
MYFADLSPCEYYGLSVGWLEKGHDFPQGAVPSGFLERLLERCRNPAIRHCGGHLCEFCPSLKHAQAASNLQLPRGERVWLGSGFIQVHPRQGVAFVAPTLVFHYVRDHGYLPPARFIEATMQNNPENAETAAERYRHGLRYLPTLILGFARMAAIRKSQFRNSEFQDSDDER